MPAYVTVIINQSLLKIGTVDISLQQKNVGRRSATGTGHASHRSSLSGTPDKMQIKDDAGRSGPLSLERGGVVKPQLGISTPSAQKESLWKAVRYHT